MVHTMTAKQPCPECVETIADWLASQHPRRTGFYANLARNQFLPKSPAQALAEECPHGMTVEAAQWVLDRLERERKDECSTIPNPTNPTTDTDLIPVPRDVLGAACYIIRKSEHAGSKTAETLREYALAAPTDPAPRYVFGPWVEAGGFGSPFPPDSEFQYAGFPTVRCNPIKSLRTCPIRRAYRIGQTYLHDGRDCPLADDRTLVRIDSFSGSVVCRDVNWPNVTSFTPLDEGKST